MKFPRCDAVHWQTHLVFQHISSGRIGKRLKPQFACRAWKAGKTPNGHARLRSPVAVQIDYQMEAILIQYLTRQ